MKSKVIAGGVILAGIIGALSLGGGEEVVDTSSDSIKYNFSETGTQTDTVSTPQPQPIKTLKEDTDYSTERSYEEFGDRDCGDFSSQSQAQSFFISQGGPSYDPHGLDRDKDGVVCESL